MRSGGGVTPGTPGVLRRDHTPAQHTGGSGTHSSTSDFLVDVAAHGPRGTHTTPSSQVPHRTQSQSGAGKVLLAGALRARSREAAQGRPSAPRTGREPAAGPPAPVCVQRPHVMHQGGARRGRGHGQTRMSPVGLQVHSVPALERPCLPGSPAQETRGGGVGRRGLARPWISRASNAALM